MTRTLTLLAVNGLAGCAGPGHVGAPPNGRVEAAVAACAETIVPATMANLRDCLDMHGISGRDMRYPDSGARRRRRRRLGWLCRAGRPWCRPTARRRARPPTDCTAGRGRSA